MNEDEEKHGKHLLECIEEMSTAHVRCHDNVLYMNHRIKARDMLKIVNNCRKENDLRSLQSITTVPPRGKATRARSIQAKRQKGR